MNMTTDTSPTSDGADTPPPRRRRVMQRVLVTRGYWKLGAVDYTDHDYGMDSDS
jgi:hypothetical protein